MYAARGDVGVALEVSGAHIRGAAGLERVERVVDATVEAYGSLDFAHNNAAIGSPTAPFDEYDSAAARAAIDVDLFGVFYGLKHQLHYMKDHGGGAIVNTASTVGLFAVDLTAPYVAAKHGVIGLTKIAASEYGRYGVRVNAVAPGTTLTGLTKDLPDEYFGPLTAGQPIKRMADPLEIAEGVVWLLSSKA